MSVSFLMFLLLRIREPWGSLFVLISAVFEGFSFPFVYVGISVESEDIMNCEPLAWAETPRLILQAHLLFHYPQNHYDWEAKSHKHDTFLPVS